jgi:hypothetical protein
MGVIVGDIITRILAEHKGLPKKVTISNNISVKNISRKDFSLGEKKEPGLTFEFLFVSNYGDMGSKIEIDINVFYMGDKKELDEIEKLWKEKKQVHKDVVLQINNRVLETGMLQAIALSNQLRLPTPIKLPKFVAQEQPKVKAG